MNQSPRKIIMKFREDLNSDKVSEHEITEFKWTKEADKDLFENVHGKTITGLAELFFDIIIEEILKELKNRDYTLSHFVGFEIQERVDDGV